MPSTRDLKIMIVDDHHAMRALVRAGLHAMGCANMVECVDGQEALEILRRRSFHLVVSDINMPRLDGLGLLRAIRSDLGLHSLAVIMLTSRAEANLVREAVTLGVNNYLVKPFTMDGLRRKVEAVFGPLT